MAIKRGQITIYIIIAIVLLGIIIGFFAVRRTPAPLPEPPDSIQSYVDSCLLQSLRESIYLNSLQGGYFLPANSSVKYLFLYAPLYWENRKANVPTIPMIENQLGFAVQVGVVQCIDDLKFFREKGYNITLENVKNVSIKILDKEVSAKVVLPIFVTRVGTVEYQEFSQRTNFDLLGKYNLVKKAIEWQNQTPDDVPIAQYSKLAYENNFKFEIANLKNNIFLYAFIFNETLTNVNYTYVFAGKYNP